MNKYILIGAGLLGLLAFSSKIDAFSPPGSSVPFTSPPEQEFQKIGWREADAVFENVTVGNIRNQQEWDVAALRNLRQAIWNRALAQERIINTSSKTLNRLGLLVQGREASGLDATSARMQYDEEKTRLRTVAEESGQLRKNAKTKMYAIDRITNLLRAGNTFNTIPSKILVSAGLM